MIDSDWYKFQEKYNIAKRVNKQLYRQRVYNFQQQKKEVSRDYLTFFRTMSVSNQDEIKKEQGLLLPEQVNEKSKGKGQDLQSNSNCMGYGGIQKSTYMQQDIDSQEQERKNQKPLNELIYISQYDKNKETTLNITKTQITQKPLQIKHYQRQEYQSISSDRSQNQRNPAFTINTKLNHRVTQQRLSLGTDERKIYQSNIPQSNYVNLKQINTFDEQKYPSLEKYESQFRSQTNSRKLNTQNVGNTLKSQQKNYAVTMKKITTSQESPIKRSQSFDKNLRAKTSSYQQKTESIKYFDANENTKKPKQTLSKNKSMRMNNHSIESEESTQPNLFYISISGKEMYPSLDLKKQTTNKEKESKFDKEKIQVFVQNSNGKVVRKSQQKKGSQQALVDSNLPSLIKISQYRSQYFLKVETQVFTIQVEYPPTSKQVQLKSMKTKDLTNGEQTQPRGQVYEIQRRFSDFVFLYDSIMINHLGYIIYPFPEKSLQSFLKIKLNSFISSNIISDPASECQAEKMQLIQRRIEELQKFVNFLLKHHQLKYSEELAIFLTPDPQLYNRSKDRIAKYIEEYKELESSGNLLQEGKKNIKKVIETGYGMVMKWWSSSQPKSSEITKPSQITTNKIKSTTLSIPTSSQHQLQQQFNQYSSMLQTCHSKYHMLQKSFIKLSETYKKILVFKDIDTDFDYLMKLCAKISSGKEFTKNAGEVIDEEVLKQIETERRWLQQAKMQLDKRQELKQLIEQLQATVGYNNDLSAKISKLSRRLDRFDKNFRFGFNDLIQRCQHTFESSRTKFMRQWQTHCTNMRRIWK